MTNASPDQSLSAAWLQLMNDLGVAPDPAAAAFTRLTRRYGEPHRHYHTLAHIAHVLQVVQQLASQTQNLTHVQLAAWLHDVVYDPRAPDNEAQSAAYSARLLQQLAQPPPLIAAVQQLILLTRHDQTPPPDRDARVLLDADLAILGAPPAAYQTYAAAIRREYHWVDDDAYRQGRTAILQTFLQRPTLYHTATMRASHEQRARHNLQHEINLLRQQARPQ